MQATCVFAYVVCRDCRYVGSWHFRPGCCVGELVEEVCVLLVARPNVFPIGVNLVDEVIARCDVAISSCGVGQHAAGFVPSKPLPGVVVAALKALSPCGDSS